MQNFPQKSTKFTKFFKTPMKQRLNSQREDDKLSKQKIATKPKATHLIWFAIQTTMLIITGIAIERIINDRTPMSEILHDIFSVSPLLILVVAMYLLAIKITKDI